MNKNIIIIGASGGIGSKLVDDLVETSFNLLLGYHKVLPSVATSAESRPVDATDFNSVNSLIEYGLEKYGSIDAIVSLPGNLILKPAHLSSEEEFYTTIDINLKSAFGVVRSAGRLLRNCSIVLMSTAAASIGLANHELIACAKSGVEGLVRSASKTYAKKDIRINSVAPGLVNTPLSSKIVGNPIALRASEKMHALGRIGKSDDIASMIRFLINPEHNWITGQNFIIDGGLSSTK